MTLRAIGYIPYDARGPSVEAGWVGAELGCAPRLIRSSASLNAGGFAELPDLAALRADVAPLLGLSWVVAEGPGGFLWATLLRAHGFAGGVTILPYLNPRRWFDVACVAAYRGCAEPRDRVLVGSTLSARIYRSLGLRASVAEPFGVDCERFRARDGAGAIVEALGIPPGRLLLFAGRAQPDKDLYRLLRVGLRARLLFSDLQLVIASHVVDDDYVAVLRAELGAEQGVHLVIEPTAEQLAALYGAADGFATAATSAFETFGRAPAEALVSGTPAVAPRYDGFIDVLDQPGGMLVDLRVAAGEIHVDEDRMLRAIYEVLSAPDPIPPARIAEVARSRFCRSRTIRSLAHVVAPDLGAAPADLAPADVAWPASWRRSLAGVGHLGRRCAGLDVAAARPRGAEPSRRGRRRRGAQGPVRRPAAMPLSIWDGMEDCLRVITGARPRAVLDVGIGFGLWGHLLRQYLDVWSGRIARGQWTTRIDGIEIDERRIQPHARHLYSNLHIGDLRALVPALAAATPYDVILFGDVLEHLEKPDALAVLDAAVRLAGAMVIVRIPMGDGWRREGREPPDHHRSQWMPDDFVPYRATVQLYDFIGNPYALVVIPAGGPAGAAAQLIDIERKLERIEARLAALLAPDEEDAP